MSESGEKTNTVSWHRKIGNRIVITAIVAAVLPLLLLGGTIAIKVRLDLVKQSVASQKALSASLLHGIGSLFHNYRRQIESVAALPAIQSMQANRQSPVVHEFLEQQRVFFGCNIYDAEGRAILVALRSQKEEVKDSGNVNIDLAADNGLSQTFRHVIKNRQAAMFASETSDYHEKMLVLLVPVADFVDPALTIGVISLAMSVSSPDIHEMIARFPIEKEDILLLLDRYGNLISAQGRLPEGLKGITVDQVSKNSLESIEIELAGVAYLGTIAPVPGSEGLLLVARPRHLVLAFLNQLLLDLILMVIVAFVMAVAAGFFMSRNLAEGISALIDAIRSVSSGVMSHRVEVRGDDELAEASKAFNEMVSTLEKHRLMDDIWSREWSAGAKRKDGEDTP